MTNISPKTQEALEKFLTLLEGDLKERFPGAEDSEEEIKDYEVTILGKESFIKFETPDTFRIDFDFNHFSLGLKEKSKQGPLKYSKQY